MTLLPKAPRALLRFDAITIQRSQPLNGLLQFSSIYEGRATLGTATASLGAAAGLDSDVSVDATLSLEQGIDIQSADRVLTARGTFTVLAVAQRRLHQVANLRRLG